MLKPHRLNRGDKVGIIVPASPVKEPYRSDGLKKIEEMGYVPVEAGHILSKNGFLAKEPEDSFADLQGFLDDGEIKAIWAGRGGYGSNLLFPLLSGLRVPGPKIVIGSSDLSYLLWYLSDRFNLVVFYGPMAYSSLPGGRFNAANFREVLSGDYSELRIPGSVLIPGSVKGIVTGGCLSNFVSLIGTPYFPKVEKRILLLEDVGERPYRLDRMLWQISVAGILSKLSGLVLGEFPGCFKDDSERESFFQRVRYYLRGIDIPVIYNLPFGHSQDIHTLPLGIEVEMDTSSFRGLIIKEKGVF